MKGQTYLTLGLAFIGVSVMFAILLIVAMTATYPIQW